MLDSLIYHVDLYLDIGQPYVRTTLVADVHTVVVVGLRVIYAHLRYVAALHVAALRLRLFDFTVTPPILYLYRWTVTDHIYDHCPVEPIYGYLHLRCCWCLTIWRWTLIYVASRCWTLVVVTLNPLVRLRHIATLLRCDVDYGCDLRLPHVIGQR